jgi:hypothetical protein
VASSKPPGSDPDSSEDGFATPAAAGLSLAIAILATAVMTQSVTELRRSRANHDRSQISYALDGAAASAEIAILESKPAERLAWRLSNALGDFDVLAEAEGPKLALTSASALDPDISARMGITDPSQLQASLAALASGPRSGFNIASASKAALWRACGRSFVSPWGQASAPHLAPASPPENGSAAGRLGEVWRLLISAKGYTDERIVRFTGDPERPASIVERRLYRTAGKGDTCDTLAIAKPQS